MTVSEVKCSTCKGTKTIKFERGQRCVPCVTCSGSGVDWRKTCEAAQSELAGLQSSCAIDRRHLDRMIGRSDDLQQRLTDAEQRNMILEAGLRDVILKCRESWTQTAIEMFAEEALETALKPTESGASE